MASLIDLSGWLDNVATEMQPNHSDLRLAADNQVDRIRERTAQGVGYDLQLFPPYAPSSKKAASQVTLRVDGSMLDSIFVEASDSQATISFSDSKGAEIASFHNDGTKHMPARPFFHVSTADKASIISDLKKAVYGRILQS